MPSYRKTALLDVKHLRYVFVTRMFSGLYETIRDREWKPSGIPTFIKLVEKIAQKEKVIWFVVCRTMVESSVVEHEFRNIVFKERINMFVIPYKHVINSGKVNAFFTTLSALHYIVLTLKSINARLFCFDRSNIVVAAIFKMISSSPVVVRMLGAYPGQKSLVNSFIAKLLSPIILFSYKRKYDLVVCTQDGSGGEYYMEKLFNRNTKKVVLLNGVVKNIGRGDYIHNNTSNDNKIKCLFVGTLTQSKGIPELINSFRIVSERSSGYALKIVGKGELFPKISSFIEQSKLNDNIQLVGAISLEEVRKYYENTDVYISLNKLGSLSNTVLEAMAAGKCIITLGKDIITHTDETTEKLISEYYVIRIDRNNIVNDLTSKLIDLIDNPEKINIYSERMEMFAKEFLWSWDERIDCEVGLLEKVFRGEPINEQLAIADRYTCD